MRPGMVRDFMTFAHGPLQNLRMLSRVFSDDEKCRFHVMSGEQIEQLRREGFAGPVIESHGHVRARNIDGVEADLRCSWPGRGARHLSFSRRRALCGSRLQGEETETKDKKRAAQRHREENFAVSSRGS